MAEDTDLTLGVEGRTWIASQGLRNFPDGEVFTGPVEDETNGEIRFSFPAIIGGREVDGVRLVFENGQVVHSEAKSGQSYLHQMLSMDDGASVLGELAIGTNYGINQFTKQILFDEKIGGTCHMALGVGYPDTGSVESLGTSLGHGARSASGRRDLRRRRADPSRRDVPQSFFEPSLAPPTIGSRRLTGRISQPIRAACAMNGRSCRRSTATPRYAATAVTAAVPSSADSGSPSGAAVTSLWEHASSTG